mmetsp:Transcript_28053/g.81094  ORF Transcript_28053/g.81094 Transcript_28053/m.81094 type:complete len:196 (-) Transcript_28053:365-952(-)|eukprot:CAMPEP_0181039568 /NCGR_PEP_ID=MMETSP1070-20121207/10554_1 /TAXON_ID=265543 /ORGANISM="Minutocellus polymorphus, Strain NH13" /LENGTH=195 /DNA_ID=CAMNT_0023117459 /DNA_START=34 /DNA_END=624 /DNA_ORIENTATION=+
MSALRLASKRLIPQAAAGAGRSVRAAQVPAPLSAVFVPVSRPMSTTTAPAPSTADSSSMPSVKDVMIKLSFVDPSGARRIVPGIIGKNLHEISELHGIELGPSSVGGAVSAIRSSTWEEPLYGEGPTSGFDHVLLVGNGADTAKPIDHVEMRMLNQYWDDDEIFPESRLASCITLTKEMDGMTVYVPDRIVDDIP